MPDTPDTNAHRDPLEVEAFAGTAEEWNRAVADLEGGTFCHLWQWSDVFATAFGHQARYFAIRDKGGEIVGLMPVVRLKSRLFGHNLLSMPFLNYGGPLGPAVARQALIERAVVLAEESGADLLELRARRPIETELPVSTEKVTVVLALPDDPQVLWEKRLKGKLRSQVRRPMKAGMTAAFGTEHLADFYRVFSRNMRDLGTPVLSRRFFDEIARAFPQEFVVAAVYTPAGEPVAAGCGFLYQGEFELTWASSLREFSRDAPNMLLYWSLMEEVIRRGGRIFNFGRCTPGSGTHQFKLQWGGEDEQLYWIRWSPAGQAAKPSKEKGVYRMAVQAWQRLPLPVANLLGPIISRGLPTW